MNLIKSFRHPAEDPVLLTGFILIGISFLTFVATLNIEASNFDPFSQTFLINYSLFIIYFIVLLVANKKQFGRFWRFKSLDYSLLLLQLGNLSAYALNRTIPVFQVSTDWLVNYLLLYNIALLLFILRKDRRPDSINLTILFVVASGFIFQLYETLYIFPFYGIGVMAFWFFGISLHVFIPVWFLIISYKVLKKHLDISNRYRPVMILGMAVPFILILMFTLRWSVLQDRIYASFSIQKETTENNGLPAWIKVSQDLPRDWISERILKSGVVYQTMDRFGFNWMPSDNFMNERRQHDPLVFIASVFTGDLRELSNDDRLSLLGAVFDQRHQTERKLWRGDNLKTKEIKTEVQLFPEYRMAYTEKTITIRNELHPNQWNTTQEALYTFFLPEGSVVTSAALWIEGEERPAYLTTKEKADSAYTAIVGRERRDPLLVHWQEGNRVTVRIFPCTPTQDRQFKLGITSPMHYQPEGELVYHNIDFLGPNWRHARESIQILGDIERTEMTANLRLKTSEEGLKYEGKYRSDWQLTFPAPSLATDAFRFNGNSYYLSELTAASADFEPQEIYLDINRSWSRRNFKSLWEQIKSQEVYVFTDKLVRMTNSNRMDLFRQLHRRNYSLFPLQEIRHPSRALVITASGPVTPTLEDLQASSFAEGLNTFMGKENKPVKVFHFGLELSDYWKSLRELRVIDYDYGNHKDLDHILADGRFPRWSESEGLISNRYAGMAINRRKGELSVEGKAPDHLMRLFVYNDLMRTIGSAYFEKEKMASDLVGMAKEAYVLSPISSLIVLETQEDYERFDIEKSKNSLQNASISLSGSVPEPEEWLLILLSLMVAAYLLLKDRWLV